ncbi:MAG: error-prone DNA polymerase [bacterium]|nr:error-prone DNA polymerase [bacterium]
MPAVAVGPKGGGEGPIGYAELHCLTNFSFLRGASHPEELVERAVELGYRALAVTDRNSLAGVVRTHVAAKRAGLRLIVGAEIVPVDAPPVVLLAPDRAAYGRLSRLITVGRRRAAKGDCRIRFDDLADHAEGLIALCAVGPDGAEMRSPAEAADAGEADPVRPDLGGIGLRSGPVWCRNHGSAAQTHATLRMLPPIAGGTQADTVRYLHRYREVFGDRAYLLAELCYGQDDAETLARLAGLARETNLPLVAANDVHYHVEPRRYLHDVLTCIRHRCTLADAGRRLLPNARRHLLEPADLARRFATQPDAIARTVAIADRCTFSLDELQYEYPQELCPDGQEPIDYLTGLVWAGVRQRYATKIPDRVRRTVEHELALIRELHYEPYFLTVWDLVRFARSRSILCQGRGSAANSAVCYYLGVTAVDPAKIDLLFERFVSRERNEPPDIDVDFEHERREEVFAYIYAKYGRDWAAIAAEVITYRPKSAVRDVGKALGLSLDCVDQLAKRLDWWEDTPLPESTFRELGLDPANRELRMLVGLVRQIMGFPRHLSQHVGGFVITERPLCETVPILNAAMPNRTFIEWDKDDLDALGMLKVDCLSLGMLTCIRKCFDMVNEGRDTPGSNAGPSNNTPPVNPQSAIRNPQLGKPLALHTVPPEDPAVYDMICAADTVGVFQIESRAQMSMLPRLKPRCFYDLVIEVAIVRPGPIQGGMVHPYLRRRSGQEPVSYPSEALKEVLGKTLGVPLFQEQAMRLAVVAAGFTPGEADELRRAMGAWRRHGRLEQFQSRLIEGMRARGYDPEFAQRCFEQIRGFGEYGFPESHAASFALLVYVSCWLKRYHPAAFAAGLINSQPMGFYGPAQIIRDARNHGVGVLGVDVNHSGYDCRLETGPDPQPAPSEPRTDAAEPSRWGCGGPALRLGFRLIRGISAVKVAGIETAQRQGPIRSIQALARRDDVARETLTRLAAADAFGSLGLNRRQALWEALAPDEPPGLFTGLDAVEPRPNLPPAGLEERVVLDYQTTGLSLAAHPVGLIREELNRLGVRPNAALKRMADGQRVSVSGLVMVRQRPGTAKGIVFITLEDETGVANLVVRPPVWERWRSVARTSTALVVDGVVERQGTVIHVMAHRLGDLAVAIGRKGHRSRDFH